MSTYQQTSTCCVNYDQSQKETVDNLHNSFLLLLNNRDKPYLHARINQGQGYLSVKLLTSFKKIKKLTRDWRVTAHALKRSKIVELSADGHRVKE